jgi:GPN-loop GTPase
MLITGLAGSGKTTFCDTYSRYLRSQGKSCYIVNLDPAVRSLPYESNLDIRDTIDYQSIMQDHKLGPNGAILSCFNIFVTKLDQVITLLQEKDSIFDYVLIDTPGQMEIFTWSASGDILCQALRSTFKDKLTCAYVMKDVVVTRVKDFDAKTLMACNIVQAISVECRMKIPMLLVSNTDFDKDCTKRLATLNVKTELDGESYAEDFLDNVMERFSGKYEKMKQVRVCAFNGDGYENIE